MAVQVPGDFDISIAGVGYMLDKDHPAFGGQSAYLGNMGIASIPLIRNQADASTEPGEATVNPEDLWPRSQHSWHKGAGQTHFDASDSDRARFRDSFGMDVWTRGEIKPLPVTYQLEAITGGDPIRIARSGDYIYYTNGTQLYWYTTIGDSVSANIAAGETADTISSIASDGYNVYATFGGGVDGIHVTTRGATSSTHYSDLPATLLGYAKGRLMAAQNNVIYNITASGPAPTALLTQPNTDFVWVAFGEGLNCIYAAGYSGDKSIIYRTAVKADGTALDVPVVAAQLPDGEIVQDICGYLGFVLIGTTNGVRVGTADGDGNITLGPLIETGQPVRCFEPQGQYVWFGWESYVFDRDNTGTGLGRIDLSVVNDTGAPAYASDLMVVGPFSNNVTAIATGIDGKRIFGVQGFGLYAEGTEVEQSATIRFGRVNYGLVRPKIAVDLEVVHTLGDGAAVDLLVNYEGDNDFFTHEATSVDTSVTITNSTDAFVGGEASRSFEVELILSNPTSASPDDCATVTQWELGAYPTSKTGDEILIPVLLHEVVETASGDHVTYDVLAEYTRLKNLEASQTLVDYQELGMTSAVNVGEASFQRQNATKDRSWWNGTCLLKLKRFRSTT